MTVLLLTWFGKSLDGKQDQDRVRRFHVQEVPISKAQALRDTAALTLVPALSTARAARPRSSSRRDP